MDGQQSTRRRLYFAYGSNMDHERMAERCDTARFHASARLNGYRFRINSRGVATVVPEPVGVVFGCVWDLGAEDLASLDRYEGIDRGFYRRADCIVETDTERWDALMYVASDAEPGSPRPDYLERLVAAAKVLGLPDEYVRELESWG